MPFGIHQLEDRDWVFKQDVTIQGSFTFGDAATDDLTIQGDLVIIDDRFMHLGTGEDWSIEFDADGTSDVRIIGADMIIDDDQKLYFGADKDISIEYDEDGNNFLEVAGGTVQVALTDAGATGAVLSLYQNSSSPAVNDAIGNVVFRGKDDGAADQIYATLYGRIDDASAGAEFGSVVVSAQNGTGSAAVCGRMFHNGSGGIISSGDSSAPGTVQSEGAQNLILATGDGSMTTTLSTGGQLQVGGAVLSSANAGAAGTNVSAQEYSDGYNHVTVLSLSSVSLGAPTAGGDSAHGALIYTFPAGAHLHSHTYWNVGLTVGGVQTDTPDVGVGSVIGSGAVATLDLVGATSEDYITGQTWGSTLDGTAEVVSPTPAVAGLFTGISNNAAADVKAVHLNAADGWNAGVTGNLTADGVVILRWTFFE